MSLYRLCAVSAVALSAACALGQVPIPSVGIRVHLGYTQSAAIPLRAGGSTHLSGLEFGVEIPVAKLPGNISVNLYPSAMLGGNVGGLSSSTDGKIYRFLASAHLGVPVTSFYAFAAAGISNTSNSGAFDDVSAFETMVGGGFPLAGILGHFSPNLEFAIHNSSKPGLRGVTIGISAAF